MHVLKFTDAQMQVLSQALVELPFKLVAPLIQSINGQIAEAQAAAQKDVEADAPHKPAPQEQPT